MAIDQSRAIAELLDKQAIAELVCTYSRAVDRQDFVLLGSLYTEDGRDEHKGLFAGSAAEYVAWISEAMKAVETSHNVHNHLISVDGDTGEGEVYVTASNRLGDGAGNFKEFVQGLRYFDRYRKTDGRWQFASRVVDVDWAEMRPITWDFGNPLLIGRKPEIRRGDDLSYRALSHPLFARR